MEWPPSLLSHREHLVQPFFYIWCKASYLQTFIDQKILSGSRIKGASAGKISLVFFHFLRMVKGQELLLSLKQKQISQESKKRVRQSICHQQQRQFFCSLEWWQVFPQNSNKNLLKKQHFSWHSNIWLRNQTHEKGLFMKGGVQPPNIVSNTTIWKSREWFYPQIDSKLTKAKLKIKPFMQNIMILCFILAKDESYI